MSTPIVRRLVAVVAALVMVVLSFSAFGSIGATAQGGNAVEIRNFNMPPTI